MLQVIHSVVAVAHGIAVFQVPLLVLCYKKIFVVVVVTLTLGFCFLADNYQYGT